MKFDQLALAAKTPAAQAKALALATFPIRDVVTTIGQDYRGNSIQNTAELSFNYTLFPGNLEFEILFYRPIPGDWNWLEEFSNKDEITTSHFGIHVDTVAAVNFYRAQFPRVWMDVVTVQHENPACRDRRYQYLILDACEQIGCALKIIRRVTLEEAAQLRGEYEKC